MTHVRREVLFFAAGGVLGLLVDASLAQVLVGWAGWNIYTARVVSFLAAATVTWWWNRRHTFAHRHSGRGAHAEWLHWMALMAVGAVINNGVYLAVLAAFPALRPWPAVAVAAGSACGAVANFAFARTLLFRSAKTPA